MGRPSNLMKRILDLVLNEDLSAGADFPESRV